MSHARQGLQGFKAGGHRPAMQLHEHLRGSETQVRGVRVSLPAHAGECARCTA